MITYHFPPDGAVGGLRWSGISKYLARRGWEIHVVTAAAGGNGVPVPGVQIHHCPRARTLNDRYNAGVQRRRAARPGLVVSASTLPTAAVPIRLHDRIRRDLGVLLAFPDVGRGWIWRAARAARSLMRKQRFDAVVSSGPPHSAHLAGVLACVGRQIPHLVDMRDPWASMFELTGAQTISDSSWVRALLVRLEKFTFQRAHRIVTNTPEFMSILGHAYPELPVSCISNGIDPDRVPPPAPKYPGLAISYAGTLYLSRDLGPVVRGMKQFVEQHPEAMSAIRLVVAGSMNEGLRVRFWKEVDAAGLHDAVEMRGRISGDEALDMINRSQLTIVLAQDQPTQIPAKLYECVAMHVPTLVIGESNSAAAREARRIGAVVVEPSDIAGIRDVLALSWAEPSRAVRAAAPIGYDEIAGRVDELLRRELTGASTRGSTNFGN
ncbi:MAG: glycosyltransferase [Gemmatimonadaceae bacterium]